MTNREEVLGLIQSHPEGLDDDDISEITGIRPRQQIQQLCNQLAASNRIRRESIEKEGKRRKIHNFPLAERAGSASEEQASDWKSRLSALVAATGRSEESLLKEAVSLLALKVLRDTQSL